MEARLNRRDGLSQKWRHYALLAFSSVLLGTAPYAAQAQSGMIGPQGGPNARPVVPTANLPSAPKRDVGPGLPGARSNEDLVAPADRPAMQMRPTEALFDAINRGDISATRDAIARGAEMNGHNILGQTPLEMAVDIGRKDIVFLLLSLRGMDDRPTARTTGRPTDHPGAAQAGGPTVRGSSASGSSAGASARSEARRPQPQPARVTAASAPRAPQLFIGDGGSPNPDAGFLGFDGGRGRAR